MIYYNDHFFERFDVLFGKKSSIVAGEEYPLGYFAAERPWNWTLGFSRK